MSQADFALVRTGQRLPRAQIPRWPFAEFRRAVVGAVADGQRVAAMFGARGPDDAVEVYAILADSGRAYLGVARTTLEGDRFPSLTPDCPQVHLFEREIAEQYGVCAGGHPWFKPVRFQCSFRAGHDAWSRDGSASPRIGITNYYRVAGDEVHEVAVGPVHAGIIEPGHFRFQCHGENVLHLEISLGYQHRGVEQSLLGGPNKRTVHMLEAVAGDSSIGHATAYSQALEALAGCQVPIRAEALRGIALELERLANHAGDLGALANDVGFLPTAAYCGRIRGDLLNLTALLCGSRFGRGLIRPGGVAFDLEDSQRKRYLERVETAFQDLTSATCLLWDSASIQARFEATGAISADDCITLGLVGPPARACGIECDVRQDFPDGIYRFAQVPVSTWQTGDVFARAYVRWLEIQRSFAFIRSQLHELPDGPVRTEVAPLKPNHLVVSLTEGWRGEICHVALTNAQGCFERYKIVDPSFHNWFGLAVALRGQQISDFPLCNKSFNLSYCGHDL